MTSFISPWRARLGILLLLLALILLNAGVLIVYRVFYEDRLEALNREERELIAQREQAKESLQKLRQREKQIADLQARLESFFSETLGTRKERLAPLIEDIYKMTGEAGLRPSSITYAEADIPGARQINLSFAIDGKYPDVKKLLYTMETSPRFLVIETVSVAFNDTQPDILRVTLDLAHFFRSDTTKIPKRVQRAGRAERRSQQPGTAARENGENR